MINMCVLKMFLSLSCVNEGNEEEGRKERREKFLLHIPL